MGNIFGCLCNGVNLRLIAAWVIFCGVLTFSAQAGSSVTNVTFTQRVGTRLVDVYYDLGADASSVSLDISLDGGLTYGKTATSYGVLAKTVSGDVGANIAAGTGKHIVWDAGADWDRQGGSKVQMRVTAVASTGSTDVAPDGMVKIAAGTYQRGDNLDGRADAPVQRMDVSQFYMQANLVTKGQWDEVRAWGLLNGYADLREGGGKGFDHPVVNVNWRDVVKWANAASEKAGLNPCYTVIGQVYRTDSSDAVECDWSANGYRLPTELEWEAAARGGLVGKRFPFGNTVSINQANYGPVYYPNAYDLSGNYGAFNNSATNSGNHPLFNVGSRPFTSPVGSFAPNGYGLYDMAGNVSQLCWDWYDDYVIEMDARGPSQRSSRGGRVTRGGAWNSDAATLRCADRSSLDPGAYYYDGVGFRIARGTGNYLARSKASANGVVDTKAPGFVVPLNMTVSASGDTGAKVVYPAIKGMDNVDDVSGITYTYSKASGATFPVGTTVVTVKAIDGIGNITSGTFTVTVTDPNNFVANGTANPTDSATGGSVKNVIFTQRAGTKLVDVYYDLGVDASLVGLDISLDGGLTYGKIGKSYGVLAKTVSGDAGANIAAGTGKHIVWDAGA
ncbi:MAG: SUMF1/EgtB/PvdO family nonheme iron enzyme, partial [Verrucomicrobiota bacterium]